MKADQPQSVTQIAPSVFAREVDINVGIPKIPDFVVGDVVFIGRTQEVGMITKITPISFCEIAELYIPGNHHCYIEILTDSLVLRDYSPLRKIFGQRL